MNILKKIVDLLVNSMGYNVVKLREDEPVNPFNVLKLILDDYIIYEPQFFIIQVGANDGVRYDPLREFILANDSHGILIEPLPDFFSQLKSNYSEQTNLIFLQSAIADTNGEKLFYRAKSDAPVEDWVHGLGSFDKEHVLQSIPIESLESVTVPTITPSSLIQKYQVDCIGLLQVDAEGYDYEVIKMFLETDSVMPKIINFENVNLSADERFSAKKLLSKYGYKFLDTGIDTIAIHETYPNKRIMNQK